MSWMLLVCLRYEKQLKWHQISLFFETTWTFTYSSFYCMNDFRHHTFQLMHRAYFLNFTNSTELFMWNFFTKRIEVKILNHWNRFWFQIAVKGVRWRNCTKYTKKSFQLTTLRPSVVCRYCQMLWNTHMKVILLLLNKRFDFLWFYLVDFWLIAIIFAGLRPNVLYFCIGLLCLMIAVAVFALMKRSIYSMNNKNSLANSEAFPKTNLYINEATLKYWRSYEIWHLNLRIPLIFHRISHHFNSFNHFKV